MFQVTTIRTLPSGQQGPSSDAAGPRVEVSTRRLGLVGRLIAGLIGLVVIAALVVLAIIAIPLLLIGLAVLAVVGGVWLLRVWWRVRGLRKQMAQAQSGAGEGRENVRVRREGV